MRFLLWRRARGGFGLPEISLLWVVVCLGLLLAVLLAGTAYFAQTSTKKYIVYRERIDLADDSARISMGLREDIRRLQDSVRTLATVREEVAEARLSNLAVGIPPRTSIPTTASIFTDNLSGHSISPQQSLFVEVGEIKLEESQQTGEAGQLKPQTLLKPLSLVLGGVVLETVPQRDWQRLSVARPHEVVTFSPFSAILQPGPTPQDLKNVSQKTFDGGPHFLLVSATRIVEPGTATGEPRFQYIAMSLNPRLKQISDDPRHLGFVAHGSRGDDAYGSEAGERWWLLHPDHGMDYTMPSATVNGTNRATRGGVFAGLSDAELLERSVTKFYDTLEHNVDTQQKGVLLDDDTLQSSTGSEEGVRLRDGFEPWYVQSKPLSEAVLEKLTPEGRPLRVKDRPGKETQLAGVKIADLIPDVPQFRMQADSADRLALARAAINDLVAQETLTENAVQWNDPVLLENYMLHINAIAYDPADPNRYLAILQGVSVEELEHEVAGAGEMLFWMVVIGLAVLGGVVFILARAMLRLNRLSDTASDMTEADLDSTEWTGRLPQIIGRLQTHRHDEVGVLCNAFAGLLNRIRLDRETLQETIESRTDQAMARATEAVHAKQKLRFFVARVNHEIRNPLTIVQGFAKALSLPNATRNAEAYQKNVRRIRTASALIELQVNDLDAATRFDGEELQTDFVIDRRSIDPRTAINETVEIMEERAAKNQNELRVQMAAPLDRGEVRIATDDRRFRQILLNLLSNACKFTHNGQIVVRAEVTNTHGRPLLQIDVEDSGRGMSAERRANPFKAFDTASSSEGNEAGTGLGLVICRSLATRLGGALELRWSEEGRGTCFTLLLPLGEVDASATSRNGTADQMPAAPRVPTTARMTLKGTDAVPTGPSEEAFSLRIPLRTDDGRGRTVLVIDDDPEIRTLIRDRLSKQGYDVHLAETGEAGLELARELNPDVITLDVFFPGGKSGWDVLAELKNDRTTRGIPVVMVTILEDRTRGFALDAADFLTKPIDPARLTEKVDALCHSRPAHVLVVEDEADQRQRIAAHLRRDGCRVTEAADGLDALRLAIGQKPDLFLIDLAMPGMDGFELIERLASDDRLKQIPIVVLTGRTLSPRELERLNQRVDAILRKGDSAVEAALDRVLMQVARRIPKPTLAGTGR